MKLTHITALKQLRLRMKIMIVQEPNVQTQKDLQLHLPEDLLYQDQMSAEHLWIEEVPYLQMQRILILPIEEIFQQQEIEMTEDQQELSNQTVAKVAFLILLALVKKVLDQQEWFQAEVITLPAFLRKKKAALVSAG